jgi:hypothetical protein
MSTLFPGQALSPGQELRSDNGLHTLILQADGNVVLYGRDSRALWSTNTWGLKNPREFVMQADGNLVLYDTSNVARWSSGTWNNPGAFLNVQDDGNLVIYRAGSQTETADNALWFSGTNDTANTSDPIQDLLAAHNNCRSEVGVPALQWSASLASRARQWADHLAQTGVLEHDNNQGNLAGGPGDFSATQLFDLWAAEKRFFTDGNFPDISTTGNWADAGHYSQVVWRKTSRVGCGLSQGNGNSILVCYYDPPGNVEGEKVY